MWKQLAVIIEPETEMPVAFCDEKTHQRDPAMLMLLQMKLSLDNKLQQQLKSSNKKWTQLWWTSPALKCLQHKWTGNSENSTKLCSAQTQKPLSCVASEVMKGMWSSWGAVMIQGWVERTGKLLHDWCVFLRLQLTAGRGRAELLTGYRRQSQRDKGGLQYLLFSLSCCTSAETPADFWGSGPLRGWLCYFYTWL